MDKDEQRALRAKVMAALKAAQSPFAPRDGHLIPPEDWPDMKRYIESLDQLGPAWAEEGVVVLKGERW